jgi:hypothetical protein
MDKPTFSRLVNLMKGAGLRPTPHISVEEKLLIHIQVLRGWTNRDIAQRFQHSGQRISKILVTKILSSHDEILGDLHTHLVLGFSDRCGELIVLVL